MYGWPLLVHYCDTCHYNTTIDYSPHVWTQDHTCSHCGVSAPGADLAGSSPIEMNQTQHDELAQLFSQAMQVSQQQIVQQQELPRQHQSQSEQSIQPAQQQSIPRLVEPVPPRASEKQNAADNSPVHYISSHYYPNTAVHIRPDTTSEPSRSPPPSYSEAVMPDAMAEVLRQHSIDPAALLPNQIHLFANADHEQRLRLLELWRIAPPSYPLEDHIRTGTWVTTSVEREEVLAKIRFDQRQEQEQMQMQTEQEQQQQQQQQQNVGRMPLMEEHDLDTFIPAPISPIREPGEVAWPPAARMKVASITAAHSRSQSRTDNMAEPYVINGYQVGHRPTSQAVDPVYAAAAGLWAAPSYAHAVEQQHMEDQYGMYEEQIRNHADWQRRNEEMAREKFAAAQGGEDFDMEL